MSCQFRVRTGANLNGNVLAQFVISFGRYLKQQRQHQNIRDIKTDELHRLNESQDALQ